MGTHRALRAASAGARKAPIRASCGYPEVLPEHRPWDPREHAGPATGGWPPSCGERAVASGGYERRTETGGLKSRMSHEGCRRGAPMRVTATPIACGRRSSGNWCSPGRRGGADEPALLRGGSWNNNARNARAANRNNNDPGNRNNNIGFRCARVAFNGTRQGPAPGPFRAKAGAGVQQGVRGPDPADSLGSPKMRAPAGPLRKATPPAGRKGLLINDNQNCGRKSR